MKKNNLTISALFGMLFALSITSCGEKPHVHNLVEHEKNKPLKQIVGENPFFSLFFA